MPHTIALQLDNPAITLEKNEGSTYYTLHVIQKEIKVDINLSDANFETLIGQGQVLIPSHEMVLTTPEVEAIRRQTAWPLKRLDGRDWQLLMREISSDSIMHVLWYLKDADLAKLVMRNMSERAAALLADELIVKFQGRDPDHEPQSEIKLVHQEMDEMLSVVFRLESEGQIVVNLK